MGDVTIEVLARAWKDEGFRKQLQEDPKSALAAFDIEIPEGVDVTVHESTGANKHLVIPANPGGDTVTSLLDCKEVMWTMGCTFSQTQVSAVSCGHVLWTLACTV